MNHFVVRSIATQLWRHETRKKLGSIIYKHSSNSKSIVKLKLWWLHWPGRDLTWKSNKPTAHPMAKIKNELGFISFDNKNVIIIIIIIRKSCDPCVLSIRLQPIIMGIGVSHIFPLLFERSQDNEKTKSRAVIESQIGSVAFILRKIII